MDIINITKARDNLYKLVEEVNDTSEPITITNNSGKNAVLVSQDDWKAIEETIYLNSIPGLADSILKGDEGDYLVYNPSEDW